MGKSRSRDLWIIRLGPLNNAEREVDKARSDEDPPHRLIFIVSLSLDPSLPNRPTELQWDIARGSSVSNVDRRKDPNLLECLQVCCDGVTSCHGWHTRGNFEPWLSDINSY